MRPRVGVLSFTASLAASHRISLGKCRAQWSAEKRSRVLNILVFHAGITNRCPSRRPWSDNASFVASVIALLVSHRVFEPAFGVIEVQFIGLVEIGRLDPTYNDAGFLHC